jgi:hypothetical protein
MVLVGIEAQFCSLTARSEQSKAAVNCRRRWPLPAGPSVAGLGAGHFLPVHAAITLSQV